ncbi:A disintegrin and metalloproteinase with thrombospondin motifs 5 [Patella vulgata]|uniref:A disintegrin and metalloproteinase with thrombospondin motifs 5 n=1 Tax=Patella vulgata TaxID=6465 RepID=UPI0024A92C8B|nr:A disintegrin and metalloproteinase with thrombospondin motifs 5 [Patella vulgata]
MCIHKDCESWENSGRNVEELEAAVVVGGWSDWGSWSVCSRTCGTGVKIARRTCNNPTYGKEDKSLGMIPSGTPCDEGSTELRNSFRCVYGYCLEFGCDGILVAEGGAYYDECGVCGGDGTTCDAVTGSFTEPGSKGTRLTIKTLPAGAHHIVFKHTSYTSQRYTYLEIWSKDDVVAISNKKLGDKDTGDTPILFAGAYWNYQFQTGFDTEDAITEPIIIKVSDTRTYQISHL